MTPRASSSLSILRPAASLTAAVRLMARPAPWQVVPNVFSMLPGCPTSTQLARPMSPGMVPGRERARRPLAVDPHLLAPAVHRVFLQLGDVVAHVVQQVHPQLLPRLAE